MLRFLAWRILQSLIVLWAVYTVTFALLMLAPGDPFIGDKKPPDSVLRGLAKTYGLDYLATSAQERANMPPALHAYYIGKSYVRYITSAATGDFGPSIEYPNFSVSDIIRTSLPVSATLGSLALFMALWIGVAAGTFSAVRKGRLIDFLLSVATLLGVSLPTFVTGALLMMLFV